MGSHKLAAFILLLGSPALAQSPTYGVGRTPTQDEVRALDISIGPTGEELPVGRGTAKEGATLFQMKGCAGCHGKAGIGAMAPELQSNKGQDVSVWERGRGKSGWMILPITAPYATIVWDYINRGMPLGREGSLKADEVYALTAYLLFVNHVIPEDQVLDKESLPKVKMPMGDDYGRLPDWKHGTPRLQGYGH
jgi:cytochrome c